MSPNDSPAKRKSSGALSNHGAITEKRRKSSSADSSGDWTSSGSVPPDERKAVSIKAPVENVDLQLRFRVQQISSLSPSPEGVDRMGVQVIKPAKQEVQSPQPEIQPTQYGFAGNSRSGIVAYLHDIKPYSVAGLSAALQEAIDRLENAPKAPENVVDDQLEDQECSTIDFTMMDEMGAFDFGTPPPYEDFMQDFVHAPEWSPPFPTEQTPGWLDDLPPETERARRARALKNMEFWDEYASKIRSGLSRLPCEVLDVDYLARKDCCPRYRHGFPYDLNTALTQKEWDEWYAQRQEEKRKEFMEEMFAFELSLIGEYDPAEPLVCYGEWTQANGMEGSDKWRAPKEEALNVKMESMTVNEKSEEYSDDESMEGPLSSPCPSSGNPIAH
ncbi:hypothetical protein NA57DRAFT_72459 [Rhizodiscina lignyota]|uniref:Uncharacterized protein n=1 Tax=Rhizodiscina lignyota TaxID=1504668 RepID=A0A9P4ILS6_9PEZI|nr:hypothetical protein NA57DRAFT_72459 [Rhizodiscina lignyota]